MPELDEGDELPGSGCHRVRRWCLATSSTQRSVDRGLVGKAVGEDGRCKFGVAVFPLVIRDMVTPGQRGTSGPGVCQRTDTGQGPPPGWESTTCRPLTNLLCLSQSDTLPLLQISVFSSFPCKGLPGWGSLRTYYLQRGLGACPLLEEA